MEWNTLGLLFVAGGRTHTTEDHGVSKKERVGKDLDSGWEIERGTTEVRFILGQVLSQSGAILLSGVSVNPLWGGQPRVRLQPCLGKKQLSLT